jgi:hypothetical protein
MPTVPSSFIPQVGMAGEGSFVPYQAPPVMPMDEAASKQQEELGRAMIAAGNTAYRLGSAIQDDIDDAATKEADTAAIGVMTKIRSDFMSTSGKDAESNYQSSVDQMSSAVNGIMDGLGNDTQKRMFQQVAARNMATFQSQMYDHRNAQTKQWASNEAAARADKYSDLAIISYGDRNKTDVAGRPMGLVNYQANLEIAVQEVRKAASLNGIPEGSEQMKAMEQKVYDKVATGVVNDLMNARQYGQAEAFLDDHPVDPKVDTSLRSSVEANRQRTTVEELTTSIMQRGVLAADSNPKAYPGTTSETDISPDTLREALQKADQIQDPEMRKLVQNNLRTQYGQQDALIEQENKTLVDNTEQFLAVPGNTIAMLPAGQFGKLRPKDQQQFLKGERQDNELGTMEELARNPSVLSSAWLEANRTKMTHATYVKLLAEVNQPQKIYEASLDADLLNKTLYDNKMGALLEDKETSLRVRENITALIDQEQRRPERKNKGPLNREEKQAIIDRELTNLAFVGNRSWYQFGRGDQKPLVEMTPEELMSAYTLSQTVDQTGRVTVTETPLLSKDQRELLEKELRDRGIPVTPSTIANLIRKMNSR